MTQLSDKIPHVLLSQYASDANLGKRLSLHETYSTNVQPWQQWVFQQLSLRAGERVLELGCGMGQLWRRNAAAIPAGVSLLLTDFSAGMLQSSREAIAGLVRNAQFAVMDAMAIEADDATFDLVVANHVLYHVRVRETALNEIRRVLKPGGRVVMTTNGRAHLCQIDSLLQRCFPQVKRDDSAEQFGLETGPAQVQAVFGNVELRRSLDELRVTDADAIVQYAVSMLQPDEVTAHGLTMLRRVLTEAIERDGVFRVEKDSGALLAGKSV